ncbi:uracil-DNA glycosylase [Algibacter pectinivorans]|uniref:Uracil-DNA glycosylase n=1 Tax=Algibacter pectinivorans TaxID=870482 RepID=A0A1I1P8Y5_9FLAO|nr:uracil-DNA glycosylase [Algibacter pectinivorans]SFD06287.1 Uracil-DNA glycosylase [Algibacter pectinivorans]
MNFEIHKSWQPYLKEEFTKPYFLDLIRFVETEYNSTICYPPKGDIFNAFNYCHFNDIKVVILGQDPYHGEGQANGLCFSVNDGIAHPPSLKNIFKELETSLDVPYPDSGNLMRWAKQGVLLLNATLTVRAHEAGSHQKKGWETFTDAVIKTISDKKENMVFLLWGGYAKKKIKIIDVEKHKVLTSGHPSPLSANRGYWFGNNHFYYANTYLERSGVTPIIW